MIKITRQALMAVCCAALLGQGWVALAYYANANRRDSAVMGVAGTVHSGLWGYAAAVAIEGAGYGAVAGPAGAAIGVAIGL